MTTEKSDNQYKPGDKCNCTSCLGGRIALMTATIYVAEMDSEPYYNGKKEGDCAEVELGATVTVGFHACDSCGKIYDKWFE